MDANEINRLAAMGSTLRPDWPTRSLATFIEKHLNGRTYGDVAVALAWVATRTKTQTPRLLLEAGAWWKAAATETAHIPRPPRRDEACGTCGLRQEQHINNPVLADHEFLPMGKGTAPDAAARHIADIRRNLRGASVAAWVDEAAREMFGDGDEEGA